MAFRICSHHTPDEGLDPQRRCGDHQDSELPGLAYPRSTKSPGPPRRVPTDGLISPPDSGSVPEPTLPFAQFPGPPAAKAGRAGHTPWQKGQAGPTRRVNSRMSDDNVRKLTPQ